MFKILCYIKTDGKAERTHKRDELCDQSTLTSVDREPGSPKWVKRRYKSNSSKYQIYTSNRYQSLSTRNIKSLRRKKKSIFFFHIYKTIQQKNERVKRNNFQEKRVKYFLSKICSTNWFEHKIKKKSNLNELKKLDSNKNVEKNTERSSVWQHKVVNKKKGREKLKPDEMKVLVL